MSEPGPSKACSWQVSCHRCFIDDWVKSVWCRNTRWAVLGTLSQDWIRKTTITNKLVLVICGRRSKSWITLEPSTTCSKQLVKMPLFARRIHMSNVDYCHVVPSSLHGSSVYIIKINGMWDDPTDVWAPLFTVHNPATFCSPDPCELSRHTCTWQCFCSQNHSNHLWGALILKIVLCIRVRVIATHLESPRCYGFIETIILCYWALSYLMTDLPHMWCVSIWCVLPTNCVSVPHPAFSHFVFKIKLTIYQQTVSVCHTRHSVILFSKSS